MSEQWTKERCDAILAIRQPLGLVGILNRIERRQERLAKWRQIRMRRLAMKTLFGFVILALLYFFAAVSRDGRDE